jgi:hypothetical protein
VGWGRGRDLETSGKEVMEEGLGTCNWWLLASSSFLPSHKQGFFLPQEESRGSLVLQVHLLRPA